MSGVAVPGRRATQVRLTIDGSAVQTLDYGDERSNQCAQIPNAPAACPNIGFNGHFDTASLPNGLHELGITVVNDRGETARPNRDPPGDQYLREELASVKELGGDLEKPRQLFCLAPGNGPVSRVYLAGDMAVAEYVRDVRKFQVARL